MFDGCDIVSERPPNTLESVVVAALLRLGIGQSAEVSQYLALTVPMHSLQLLDSAVKFRVFLRGQVLTRALGDSFLKW